MKIPLPVRTQRQGRVRQWTSLCVWYFSTMESGIQGGISMRENLRAARKAKGLTQQQMADKLWICLRHYQRIESGVSCGTCELWDMLEDLLSVRQRTLREISANDRGLKASR